ncbi:hypothetical protein KOR42_36100 [Thalassoglobus neptunius]|uniref:DUF4956 domain-containing protein n=1 Tax=Thalassoglobus neptunius TaxID=1938619 RepID=A0A5C5WGZ1_9PLAN|nr:DUF4956 domain-containing protein [Thalassoglobus neptunius]TWT50064.1 hypothetical protein KOR42_36100 [Thalassoglobus neptunius]
MEFLEIPLFDDDLIKMLVRFAIDIVVVLSLTTFCYRRHKGSADYVFSFLLLNVMIFFICFALKKLDLGIGMALGLFAIFGIIRYRTDAIRVKEMTYLFVVVGIAVINALSNKKTSYAELAAMNGIILSAAFFLEQALISAPKCKCNIVYDNIALLSPGNERELLQDIESRTGLSGERVKISKIDLKKGLASIVLHYSCDDATANGDGINGDVETGDGDSNDEF